MTITRVGFVPSEQVTVGLIQDKLRVLGFMNNASCRVFPQTAKGQDEALYTIQKGCSKKQNGQIGHPEYMIRTTAHGQLLIVIEAKAEKSKHIGHCKHTADILTCKPKDTLGYAVDGALWYSKCFSEGGFTVISIAVSGTDPNDLLISTYIQKPGEQYAHPLCYPNNRLAITELVDLDTYIQASEYDPVLVANAQNEMDAIVERVNRLIQPLGKTTSRALTLTSLVAALQQDDVAENMLAAGRFEEKREILIEAIRQTYQPNQGEDEPPAIQPPVELAAAGGEEE